MPVLRDDDQAGSPRRRSIGEWTRIMKSTLQRFLAITSSGVVFALAMALAGCDRRPDANQAGGPSRNLSAEKAAIFTAQAWLQLVDGGEYARSWETAASAFQSANSKEDWQKSLESFRAPLGHVLTRSLISQSYQTSLPGSPDGEYVAIQYKTSFANKQDALEIITPMLDKDGKWRVAGYVIK